MENKFDWIIIDGDPLVYRCGFAIEKRDNEAETISVEPVQHAYYNINSMMKKILALSKDQNYKLFLTSSDKSNFRFEIFPAYKANRKDARKPVYYNELREFMITKWKAEVISGQEADDQCSIEHCAFNNLGFDKAVFNSVVCSFDKDFNNIPGWHYNYVKNKLYFVEEIDALRTFYLQILTGDISDGIPRIKKGWFQKQAEMRIMNSTTELELYGWTKTEIGKVLGLDSVESEKRLIERARLVWLRRHKDEMWSPEL